MTNNTDNQLQEQSEQPILTWQHICSQLNKPRFIPENKTIFGVNRRAFLQEQKKQRKGQK
tara:strand:+ start:43 stop:222 length:180 start_codon:yes stop_codon:yes gene_type:complete